jgi:alpha-glucosidase/alpha-D-xyloside xylohydrolase
VLLRLDPDQSSARRPALSVRLSIVVPPAALPTGRAAVGETGSVIRRSKSAAESGTLFKRSPRTTAGRRRRWSLIPLLFACASASVAAENKSPLRVGGFPVELTVNEVSDRTVRLEFSPLDEKGDPRSGTPSTVLVRFSETEKLRARELPPEKELRVGQLRLTIKSQPLSIAVRRGDGTPVQELTFEKRDGTNAIWFQTRAPVFGLGEGEEQFDRRGHFYRMRNGQLNPMLATHGATIPVPFLIGADGWALFFNRTWGEFDLRGDHGCFLPAVEAAGREPLEIFIMSTPEPADAFAEFIRLTGHAVMPPKWTMGYMQSHRTLLGPDDALQVAKTFREKKLPCDALIYLGTGYCTNGWNVGNGTIDFNTNAFPHPANEIRALQAEHFKVILHVNQAPRNLFGTSLTPPQNRAEAKSPPDQNITSRGPYLTQAQRAELGSPGTAGGPEDFNSLLHIRNYWAWHHPVFALGIDGWWPDDGDELPIEARLARHRCYFEGPLQERPNERPWSLHRNGYAGIARYGGWIWSGDVQSRWATLAAHVPVGLNCSLSVTPFWGTDIGGFVPTPELTGELFVRWFQFGTFNPLFRSHGRDWHLHLPWGWNTGEPGPLEPRDVTDPAELHNADVEPICRKYLELRYRMLPYNYSVMRETCDTGLPPMRALWLHYPDDPETIKLGDEFLWGRDLLIAPVVEKGAALRRVYLPAGSWFDWWTGEKLDGKRWIERPVDLATMPIYARAGAIIPLDPIRQYTAEPTAAPTTLRIFPGADGVFTLYDDDGQGLDYRDGSDTKTVWIRMRWNDRARRLTLEPDARMKTWGEGVRVFNVQTPGDGSVLKQIEFRGRTVESKS